MDEEAAPATLSYPEWLEYRESGAYCEIGSPTKNGDQTFVAVCDHCPIDNSLLKLIDNRHWDGPTNGVTALEIRVGECMTCGWWQLYVLERWTNDAGWREGRDSTLLSAILRRASSLADAPLNSLRDYLYRNPSQLNSVEPKRMERLVADVFKEFFSCEVKHVGRSGDGGIDLIMVQGDDVSAIQVKRREIRDRSERVSTVRELVGAMVAFGLKRGKVVTTAQRFGRSADRYIAEVRKESFQIELINCDAFLGMLNCVQKSAERPWVTATRRADIAFGIKRIRLHDVFRWPDDESAAEK